MRPRYCLPPTAYRLPEPLPRSQAEDIHFSEQESSFVLRESGIWFLAAESLTFVA
jgi:hypothetical protein